MLRPGRKDPMWWTAALAADWPMLQGTEPAGGDAIAPWGFAQVVGEGLVAGPPVEGLSDELRAFEGQRATFSRLGTGEATVGLTLRRARAGLRGQVPGTDGSVNWLVALEFGDNGVTRTEPVVPTDASVTVSYLPGVRVRVGQFKLPLGDEALEMNPIAAEFVNVTTATSALLAESPIADGAYTGGTSGFRDLGAMAFDTLRVGHAEVSYALEVSNGRMGSLEIDDPKDVTGRLAFTPWVWGENPRAAERDELGVWAFHQQGRRSVDGAEGARVRQGAGVKLEREGWQLRGEILHGAGAIELGPNPPFPGRPVAVALGGRALGGYVSVHHEWRHVAGGLRYDALRRETGIAADARVFRTATADLQLLATERARMMVDYELRTLSAPDGSADARQIASTLADRVSVQLGVVF